MGPPHPGRTRRDAPALPGGEAGAGDRPDPPSGRSTRTCRPTPSSNSPPRAAASAAPAKADAPPRSEARYRQPRRQPGQGQRRAEPDPGAAAEAGRADDGSGRAGRDDPLHHPPGDTAGASAVGHAEDHDHARVREPLDPAAHAADRRPRLSPRCRRRRLRPARPSRQPSRRPSRNRLDDAGQRRRRGAATAGSTPSLLRRMACFVYEATLLFGIALVPAVLGTLFFAQTGQDHPLQSEGVVRIFALVIYGIYFVGCWSVRGQTLAMQTWRIRVVTAEGARVGQARALVRYVACCIAWFGAGDAGRALPCTCAPGRPSARSRSASSSTRCSPWPLPGGSSGTTSSAAPGSSTRAPSRRRRGPSSAAAQPRPRPR